MKQDIRTSARSPWKAIVAVMPMLIPGLLVRVGNGRRTRFWHDCWTDCGVLSDYHPASFTLSLCKEGLVDQVTTRAGLNLHL